MASTLLRNFVFTINNPEGDEVQALYEKAEYIIWGKEVGEEGTPHLQGYCELKNRTRFSTIKNLIPRAYIDRRKGTAKEASDYCKKDGDYFEQGTMSAPGTRTDIKHVATMVVAGKRMRDVAEFDPASFVKYHKGLHCLQKTLIPKRNSVPEVKVWWGPTGTGKTMRAKLWLGPDHFMWTPAAGKWFDGYEGEECVLFDEFRGQLPFGQLLNLLDRYDCQVEYKGGMCQFRGIKIGITSPLPPLKWFKNLDEEDKADQLLRRITSSEQTGHVEGYALSRFD